MFLLHHPKVFSHIYSFLEEKFTYNVEATIQSYSLSPFLMMINHLILTENPQLISIAIEYVFNTKSRGMDSVLFSQHPLLS